MYAFELSWKLPETETISLSTNLTLNIKKSYAFNNILVFAMLAYSVEELHVWEW